MSPSDAPNPERRSNSALLCFCIGIGLCGLAYFLGIGAVMAAAFSGGNPAAVVGSILGVVAVATAGVIGFVMTAIGAVWMLAQVIADQRGGAEEKRYRDVER